MSDATKPSDNPGGEETYAYPNPVRPNYTGLITVVGLAFNSDVKIVTTNGVLVAKGTSNGGTIYMGRQRFKWKTCSIWSLYGANIRPRR